MSDQVEPDLPSGVGHRWYKTGPGWACRGHCHVIALGPSALEALDAVAVMAHYDPDGVSRELCAELGIEPTLPSEVPGG